MSISYEITDEIPPKAERSAVRRTDIDFPQILRLAYGNPGMWVKIGPFPTHSNSLAARNRCTNSGLTAVSRTLEGGVYVFASDGGVADDDA